MQPRSRGRNIHRAEQSGREKERAAKPEYRGAPRVSFSFELPNALDYGATKQPSNERETGLTRIVGQWMNSRCFFPRSSPCSPRFQSFFFLSTAAIIEWAFAPPHSAGSFLFHPLKRGIRPLRNLSARASTANYPHITVHYFFLITYIGISTYIFVLA